MAAVELVYIYCDAPGCERDAYPHRNDPLPDEGAADGRAHAKVDGWARSKGKDYCPECWLKLGRSVPKNS